MNEVWCTYIQVYIYHNPNHAFIRGGTHWLEQHLSCNAVKKYHVSRENHLPMEIFVMPDSSTLDTSIFRWMKIHIHTCHPNMYTSMCIYIYIYRVYRYTYTRMVHIVWYIYLQYIYLYIQYMCLSLYTQRPSSQRTTDHHSPAANWNLESSSLQPALWKTPEPWRWSPPDLEANKMINTFIYLFIYSLFWFIHYYYYYYYYYSIISVWLFMSLFINMYRAHVCLNVCSVM